MSNEEDDGNNTPQHQENTVVTHSVQPQEGTETATVVRQIPNLNRLQSQGERMVDEGFSAEPTVVTRAMGTNTQSAWSDLPTTDERPIPTQTEIVPPIEPEVTPILQQPDAPSPFLAATPIVHACITKHVPEPLCDEPSSIGPLGMIVLALGAAVVMVGGSFYYAAMQKRGAHNIPLIAQTRSTIHNTGVAPGWLTLSSEPRAQVILDGMPIGTTPLERLIVDSGTYEMVLTDVKQHAVHQMSIRIKPGETTHFNFDLKPKGLLKTQQHKK